MADSLALYLKLEEWKNQILGAIMTAEEQLTAQIQGVKTNNTELRNLITNALAANEAQTQTLAQVTAELTSLKEKGVTEEGVSRLSTLLTQATTEQDQIEELLKNPPPIPNPPVEPETPVDPETPQE